MNRVPISIGMSYYYVELLRTPHSSEVNVNILVIIKGEIWSVSKCVIDKGISARVNQESLKYWYINRHMRGWVYSRFK